jgi:hypothetical protein
MDLSWVWLPCRTTAHHFANRPNSDRLYSPPSLEYTLRAVLKGSSLSCKCSVPASVDRRADCLQVQSVSCYANPAMRSRRTSATFSLVPILTSALTSETGSQNRSKSCPGRSIDSWWNRLAYLPSAQEEARTFGCSFVSLWLALALELPVQLMQAVRKTQRDFEMERLWAWFDC